MKKLFLLVAVVSIALTGCGKIEDAIDKLENRLDNLEQEKIPTIDEQISAINTTLGTLDDMDKELKGYIDGLQVTADNLQKQINDTNTKIDEVKVALQGEISTAKAEVLAQLEAAKKELENELKTINETIKTLQDKDEELDGKITDLRTYVDTELGETTDWVEATFATLEQYNALVSEVATIKEQITAINQSITELETRLTTKINEDIANAVSTLDADIQQKVKEITDGYTDAVKTAKEDITAAYTAAIQTAISNLDSSLKTWVGEQLANYYTIAEVDAKITALQTTITDGDSALQKQLDELKSQLTTTKQEITEAYKTAIKEAIETNNGVINAQITSEIAIVNQRIDSEVATINAKIATLEAQVNKNTEDIAKLLARIQSISYIPTYSDGKATVKCYEKTSQVTLDFEISPKDVVRKLAKCWQDAVSLNAVYTQTRAVSFIDMPITKFETDSANGVISITASGENLSEAFFAGTQSASVRLSISDGNNSVTSDYIPLVGKEVTDEIWYTSTDGAVVTPYATDVFGANIVSNTYENGKGVIKFDGDVTSIGEGAFYSCYLLTSITIPNSVTSIGRYAFSGCTSLTSVTIPNSVTSIGYGAFQYCYSLKSVTIPDSVTSIGYAAFSSCDSLTSVTIPDSVISIGNSAFRGCSSLTSITIPNSVTSIGEQAFEYCYSLTSITIPDNVISIGKYAFNDCSSLTSITIPNSVTSIGYNALSGCKGELIINSKIIETDYTYSTCPEKYGWLMGANFTKLTIGNSVTLIGNYVFSGCESLTSITIPDSVTSIGDSAFYLCTSLTSVTIPDSVTSIGEWAFYLCTSLTSITIPDSVTSIGKYAFAGCTSLTSVYCKPTTPPTGGDSMFDNNASERKIYVPGESLDAYKTTEYWSDYAAAITADNFRIYVYTANNSWSKHNLYTWDAVSSTPYTGSWPGSEANGTEVINGYTYQYWDMPANANDSKFNAILNDGTLQTSNFGPFTLSNDVYLLLNSTTVSVIEDINNPEPATPIQKCKIYATTTLNWSKMNIYAWGGISSAGWPGSAMTKETIGGVTYYSYEVDKGVKGNIIFNNGSAETVDITNVAVDSDVFYQINTTKSGGKYTVTKIADPR